MMTVNEVSKISGVSIRTLQYYDKIGLLQPVEYTDSGYRMYDSTSLERLQQILLLKELEFPLKDIINIIDSPNFDKSKALEQQIQLLTMKKEHLEKLIRFAKKIKTSGGKEMNFKAFDKKGIEDYAKKAKEEWGHTKEYKEYEKKFENRTAADKDNITDDFMAIFTEFGQLKNCDPGDSKVQYLVGKLKDYITEHFYNCSNEILGSLGKMYAAGGEFTENIDKAGGTGTAEFTNKAIEIFTKQ